MTLTIELGENEKCLPRRLHKDWTVSCCGRTFKGICDLKFWGLCFRHLLWCVKKALSFLLALVPVLHSCHPHIYLSLWKNECKLAGHKEIFILFMANANANLYQLILSSTLTHHFFSYCFTKVSIFMSGSSVKIMFTSCICLFSNFGNCQPEIYFFLVLHKIWLRISPMCNVKWALINLWFLLVTSYTELVGL